MLVVAGPTVLQKEKYLQHLRNFCDRDYKIENNEIIFTGNGASCSNILHCKNYLNPLYFKTFRETAKDLIIGINGELSLDLPQHTSQMAKGARKLGFLKPFGKLGEEIDWDFCSMIEQNYGFHFEHLFF